MTENRKEEDNRKYPRLKKDVMIDFKLVNSPDKCQEVISEDISPGGVKIEMIYTDQSLSEGQFIEMFLKENKSSKAVKVLGQIIWVDRMKFSLKIRMGIKLVYLSDEDAEKIKKFLK